MGSVVLRDRRRSHRRRRSVGGAGAEAPFFFLSRCRAHTVMCVVLVSIEKRETKGTLLYLGFSKGVPHNVKRKRVYEPDSFRALIFISR
jgi:hypothetical protein